MVEQVSKDPFVPNDIDLGEADGKERFMIITGPNMGGKSSYIRQTALIIIMAQIGCFVPADEAEIGIFDAIYTRMGARDNLAQGRSTFLVELGETSNILKKATNRSLVILDELGRGTSTYDGVAIASATLDYIIRRIGCFTMFVTHYPLLAKLQDRYPKLVGNYHMAFMEKSLPSAASAGAHDTKEPHSSSSSSSPLEASQGGGDEHSITFLYKLVPGISHRSYGLNVARLADIPGVVVDRAAEKAIELEHRVTDRRAQRHTANSEHSSDDKIKASHSRIAAAVESYLHGNIPLTSLIDLQHGLATPAST